MLKNEGYDYWEVIAVLHIGCKDDWQFLLKQVVEKEDSAVR